MDKYKRLGDDMNYNFNMSKIYMNKLEAKIKELEARIDKSLFNIQRIIAYGFDYDGFNSVESLKGLIDMLVDYAEKAKDILKGENDDNNSSSN